MVWLVVHLCLWVGDGGTAGAGAAEDAGLQTAYTGGWVALLMQCLR
jgi:hypothetical protein